MRTSHPSPLCTCTRIFFSRSLQLKEDNDEGARLKKQMRALDLDGTGHLSAALFRQALAATYGMVRTEYQWRGLGRGLKRI